MTVLDSPKPNGAADFGGEYPVRRRASDDPGHAEDQGLRRAVLLYSGPPPPHSAQRGGEAYDDGGSTPSTYPQRAMIR